MKHIFEQGTSSEAPVLLLLHGTGGNERDLLPLAKMLSPESSVLSVRGSVLENGMPRFFRRLREGVFDEADLVFRTSELNAFLNEAAQEHGFDRSRIVAVGYSNGANIAGSLLFHYKDALAGAILYHPMVPLRHVNLPDITKLPVFIGAGTNDPICTVSETEELAQLLKGAKAEVELHWDSYGHQLSASEVEASRKWLQEHFK